MRFLEQTITTPTYALALICASTLLVSACEAQKPAASAVDSNLPKRAETSATTAVQNGKQPDVSANNVSKKSATASPLNNGQPLFSEPAVIGKIIDAQTKQPIEGALVYGFYATHGGGTLAGGSKFGEHVKSFEVETDANGLFKLEAWNTGDRTISGTIGTKFPMMAIYKPGYDLWFDQMSGIKQYRPKSGIAGTEVAIQADGTRDWMKYPHQLVPLTSERDRYEALDNSARMMMFQGECGWEAYAKTLLAQHNELKDWYKRNLPSDAIDGNGYMKGTAQKPQQFRALSMVFQTSVDQLIKAWSTSGKQTNCASPAKVFEAKK
jgi:hypothetical protein